MQIQSSPRMPTAEEKEQLVNFMLRDEDPEAYDLGKVSMEAEQVIKGYVEAACIAVFDHYITDSPGYAGKVMVVVWAGSPKQTETFTWDHGNLEQEVKANW